MILWIVLLTLVLMAIWLLWRWLPFYSLYAEKADRACTPWQKQQWVRLLDILVLGPVAIWLAYRVYYSKPISPVIGIFVLIYGLLTIVYNFSNYSRNLLKIKDGTSFKTSAYRPLPSAR